MASGKIWDAKESSFENTPHTREGIKKTLENHIKKAKKQADNMVIVIPDWIPQSYIDEIIANYLSRTKHDRWIVIMWKSGNAKLFKK